MSADDCTDDPVTEEWITGILSLAAGARRLGPDGVVALQPSEVERLIHALQAARDRCRVAEAESTAATAVYYARLEEQREQLATATAMVAQLRDAFHTAVVALHVHGMHRANFIDCDVKLCADAKAMVAGELESLATAHDAAVRRAALLSARDVICEGCREGWPLNQDGGIHLVPPERRQPHEVVFGARQTCAAEAIRRLAETP